MVLKQALATAPVLQLTSSRNLLCNAMLSGSGFGTMHQGGSQSRSSVGPFLLAMPSSLCLSASLSLGRSFLVQMDHYSLTFLLDQCLSKIPHHHWMIKLMGYDFHGGVQARNLNIVVGALSRQDDLTDALACAISSPRLSLFDELRATTDKDPNLVALREEVLTGQRTVPWSVVDDLSDKRIYVSATSPNLPAILQAVHEEGHGVQKTLQRPWADFHVPRARQLVQESVRDCAPCEKNKMEHPHPVRLLQPFDVPTRVWADISMDFIEGLQRVHGKAVISLSWIGSVSMHTSFRLLIHTP